MTTRLSDQISIRSEKSHNSSTRQENPESTRRSSGRTLRTGLVSLSLLPLAACGGGGSASPTTPTVPTTPDPDFTENPTNVFTAIDDNDRTLVRDAATADLTVIGLGGDDDITTGSGDDMIRGGGGADRINAGNGDDVVVVVGTTTANQYTSADITNPAGSGIDLSAVLSLDTLNGQSASEAVSGEYINGGAGNNTLYIYGTVDLTGVTITNLTQLIVNSDVTLTSDQLSQFTTVDGDGNSIINIVVPAGSSAPVDLSSINLSDIGSLNVEGDLTLVIDNLDDLAGITSIASRAGSNFTLRIDGDVGTEVNLSDLAGILENVDTIDLGPNVTLNVDSVTALTNLGLSSLSGDGVIATDGSPEILAALDSISLDIGEVYAATDSFTVDEDNALILSIQDDLLGNDSSLTGLDFSMTAISLTQDASEHANLTIDWQMGIVIITPDIDYDGDLEVQYTIQDTDGNTDTGRIAVDVNGVNDLPTAYGANAVVGIGETRELAIDGSVIIDGIDFGDDGHQLHIEDADSSLNSIVIRVDSISHGEILVNGSPANEFTYGQVASGQVEFSHSGGTALPTLIISLSNDGVTFSDSFNVVVQLADIDNSYVLDGGYYNIGSGFTAAANESYFLDAENEFFYSSSVSATLTNYGNISGFDGGGYITPLYFDNGNFVNYGEINAEGGGQNAMAFYLNGDGTLTNYGLIDVSVSSNLSSGTTAAIGTNADTVTNSGTMLSQGMEAFGVLTGKSLTLDNSGYIVAHGTIEASAVYVNEDGGGTSTITNSGLIEAKIEAYDGLSYGLEIYGASTVVNNSGVIRADTAIYSSGSIDIDNSGEIFGRLQLSNAVDTVTNSGLIVGDIHFLYGDDSYTSNDGIVQGIVFGDTGNDTLRGGSTDDYLDGGTGADILYTGTGGADYIYGGADQDLVIVETLEFVLLDGGEGNDIITFENFGAAVTVDMEAGTVSSGDLEGGVFQNFSGLGGTIYDDVLMGTEGDDFMLGVAGNDTYIGRGGDDAFILSSPAQINVDGGSGEDLIGIGADLDLSSLDPGAIQGIEKIDISGDIELTLTASDLLDLSDTSDQLIVLGDAGNAVTSTGQGWVQGTDQVINGETYNVFTSGLATLLVDADITQTIS